MKAIKIASGENAKLRLVTVTGGERTELECECELRGGDGRHIIKYKDGAGKVMMKLTSERAETSADGRRNGLKAIRRAERRIYCKDQDGVRHTECACTRISHKYEPTDEGVMAAFSYDNGNVVEVWVRVWKK